MTQADELFAAPQSYVVKLWIEPPESTTGANARFARGVVTQVDTGKRWYVKDLDELADLFARRVSCEGVRLGLSWRIWRQVRHMRSSRRFISQQPVPTPARGQPNSEAYHV